MSNLTATGVIQNLTPSEREQYERERAESDRAFLAYRRETIATQAMQGLAHQFCPDLDRGAREIARDALALADALIAALDAPAES